MIPETSPATAATGGRTIACSRLLISCLAAIALTACGGGGSSGGGGNQGGGNSGGQPTITEQALASAATVSAEPVTLQADALLPTGFEAQSWQWRQLAGTPVDMADPTAENLEFDSPETSTTETLRFELSASDSNGDRQIAPIDLAVVNPAQVEPVPNGSYQLEQRPANTTCQVPDTPASPLPFALTPVFPTVSVEGASDMDQAPGDDSHWYVTYIFERKIRRFATGSANPEAEVVLDLSSTPGRVRSMAFHPDFASNGKIYVHMHNGTTLDQPTTIREYTWSDSLGAFDPSSERLILAVDSTQDAIEKGEHPGGNLNFGPDGYLYTALGDGTDPGYFNENAQLTDNLWGSLLRIDVDGGSPYAIPADNPFADGGGRPEIYAWGFRHPWKWSFDRDTGEIWLADVGLVNREEIDLVVKGGNYGWPMREGFIKCPKCQHDKITVDVDPDELIDPVVDYGRDLGRSVTGGYVYRGRAIPELWGVYVFADYLSGNIFAVRDGGSATDTPEVLTQTSINIVTFARDIDGELYALDFENGGIYKFAPNEGTVDDDFPRLLSETGCVDMSDPSNVIPGMIPYTVQVPLWSDHAEKSRWLALPDGTSMEQIESDDGDLDFPVGTVLVKHFRLFKQLIETRLLMRHEGGQWAGYSYEWNDSETEATLLEGGKLKDINGQLWQYPSGAECLQCHTRAAGWVLGPTVRQLNTYQDDGEALYSQLQMLEDLALFAFEPDHSLEFAAPDNPDASLDDRARAYLDVNCAGCHRPGGEAGRSEMDLRADTALAETGACNQPPLVESFGNPEEKLVVPGNPENSILYYRISHQEAYRMPPLGSSELDAEGMRLVEDWILSLDSCQ
jgi:uncharacterized repeat protein (TIGR03806 family)